MPTETEKPKAANLPKHLRKLVYLAGPMTIGDRDGNVKIAMAWARKLVDAGYSVFCPHLSSFFPWAWDKEYGHDFWMEFDFPMLVRSDYFVRIESDTPSDGADDESEFAFGHGIPRWDSVESFLEEDPQERIVTKSCTVKGGALSHFPSGAVRSADADEFRFDLLSPIAVDMFLAGAMTAMTDGWPERTSEAIRSIYLFLGGDGDPVDSLCVALECIGDAMKSRGMGNKKAFVAFMHGAAAASREGQDKYGDYNWEKGMPADDLINHAIRHLLLAIDEDNSEAHFAHASWNLMAAIHSLELWPELNKGKFRTKGCKPPSDDPDARLAWGVKVAAKACKEATVALARGQDKDIAAVAESVGSEIEGGRDAVETWAMAVCPTAPKGGADENTRREPPHVLDSEGRLWHIDDGGIETLFCGHKSKTGNFAEIWKEVDEKIHNPKKASISGARMIVADALYCLKKTSGLTPTDGANKPLASLQN